MADFKDYATSNQLKAVVNRGHDILVSASAGSGKTKVLVERIKDEIINENANISRMLIMTFTNAAAKEMKERLTNILQKELDTQLKLQKNPHLIEHLQKQLTAVNIADISTIDAFCLRFLKKYYYAINLDPNFRVLADESERDVLREDVWENVRERFYQNYEDLTNKEERTIQEEELLTKYNDLLQLFTGDRRDDALTEVIYQLNDFASANENPDKWLQSATDNYLFETKTFTQTSIWEVIKPNIVNLLQDINDNLSSYWSEFEAFQVPLMREFYNQTEKEINKLNEKIDADQAEIVKNITQIKNIIAKIEDNKISWDEMRDQINELKFTFKRYTKKQDFPAEDEYVEQINHNKIKRNDANKELKDLRNSYLMYSDKQLKEILRHAYGVVELIVDLVKKFRTAYLDEKLRRHALEFSDLEHLTLKILQGKTPVQQKIREELRLHYSEIMLDEYQDTNGVQEAIVQAIANHNIFMVGDVKQSIYRFRQADPNLFMKKYQGFKSSERSNDVTNGELIVLQENFRSIKNIADLTNLIFMQIMDEDLGEINYDDAAFLKAENPAYKDETLKLNDVPVTMMIYLSKQQADVENVFQLDEKTQGQFVMIANKIHQMMADKVEIFDRDQGRKRLLQYSDIAILSSSHQDSLLVNDEFKRLGIPTDVDETNNYFKTTEIQIMVSYLKVIDNPHQDIPLVAVLRSPMYCFDENQLAYLRVNHPDGDFFSALTDYQGKYANNKAALKPYDEIKQAQLYEKINRFTDDLTTFRVQAKRSELATLIWNIYTTTGFLDFVGGMPGGSQRQANLHALYERATAYEKTSFKGLFQFIRFIERMDKQQKDLPEMKLQVNNDAVKFMTIHKSKGLEFPVVFVTDLSKKFNLQDINKKYVLDDQLGIGIDIVESSKVTLKRDYNIEIREDDAVEVQENTPIRLAIKDQLKRKALAEEMRKLYVALTRAEQQIYLVGSYATIDQWAQTWSAANQDNELVIAENKRIDKSNYMDWIGQAIGRKPNLVDETTVFQLDDNQIKAEPLKQAYSDTNKYFRTHHSLSKIQENQLNFKVDLWSSDAIGFIREKEQQSVDEDEQILQHDVVQPLNADARQILDFKYPHFDLTFEPAYQAVTDIKRLFEDPDNDLMSQLRTESFNGDQVNLTLSDKNKTETVVHAFGKPKFVTTEIKASPAQVGSATHLLFQRLSLIPPITSATIENLLSVLVTEGSITPEVAAKVNIDGIAALYQTNLGQKMLANNQSVKREVPFSLLLPANILMDDLTFNTDKKVLIHGIIDGYFEDEQTGEIYLFDYKTDHTSLAQIKKDYYGQLSLYALALESITGKQIAHCYLYSVMHQQLIEV